MVSPQEYERQLLSAIRASGMESGYLRVMATRGVGDLGINPARCSRGRLVIIVARLQLYPPAVYETGIRVIVAKTQKIPVASFDCRVKACNYLTNVMATWEAVDAGADEALMSDDAGIVSEATVDNVFGVRGGAVFTPALETNCLAGITRQAIIEIARGLGVEVREGRFRAEDFASADEVFLTGTGAGVVPVRMVDERIIGGGGMGPVTRRLRREYESRLDEFYTPLS